MQGARCCFARRLSRFLKGLHPPLSLYTPKPQNPNTTRANTRRQTQHAPTRAPNLGHDVGPKFESRIWPPNLKPKFGLPNVAAQFRAQMLGPNLGPNFDSKFGPCPWDGPRPTCTNTRPTRAQHAPTRANTRQHAAQHSPRWPRHGPRGGHCTARGGHGTARVTSDIFKSLAVGNCGCSET